MEESLHKELNTTTTCAFYMHKSGMLKIYTPIIIELICNKVSVIIYAVNISREDSTLARIIKDELQKGEVTSQALVQPVEGWNGLNDVLEKEELDFMIVSDMIPQVSERRNIGTVLNKRGIPIFGVQHTFDLILEKMKPENVMNYLHKYYTHGSKIIDWYCYEWKVGLDGQVNALMRNKFIPVGSVIFESLNLRSSDEIKEEYNLPKNQKIVLFMPPHLKGLSIYNDPFYNNVFIRWNCFEFIFNIIRSGQYKMLFHAFSIIRFNTLVRNVKTFCKNNNAFMVVKVRNKNVDSGKIRWIIGDQQARLYKKYADVIIGEKCNYPYTTMELLKVADLAIQFKSSSIIEIIKAGVPNITVLFDYLSHLYEKTKMYYTSGLTSLFSPEQFIKKIAGLTLNDFSMDQSKRDEMLEHYLGNNSEPSSKLIVKDILSTLNSRNK